MLRRRLLRSLAHMFVLVCLLNNLRTGLPSRAQVDAPSTPFTLQLPLIVHNYSPGTITGQVIDASDPLRHYLEDVSVCTSPTNCVLSNSQGVYSIKADAGLRTLSAYKTGYYVVTRQVMAIGNQTVNLNIALTSYLSSGAVDRRMVLTWSANPYWCQPEEPQCENDLDAHLWMKASLPWHIYTDDKGDCTTYPNACLELDTRKGFGPETIAITHFELQTIYYYGVMNYNQGNPGVPPITETGAHVEIYDQSGSVMAFDVPQTGDGNFWYVFNYSQSSETGDWVIEPVNCITLYNEVITETISQCQ